MNGHQTRGELYFYTDILRIDEGEQGDFMQARQPREQ
jgi:hypothetical protein